jgi:hypothetical protein
MTSNKLTDAAVSYQQWRDLACSGAMLKLFPVRVSVHVAIAK